MDQSLSQSPSRTLRLEADCRFSRRGDDNDDDDVDGDDTEDDDNALSRSSANLSDRRVKTSGSGNNPENLNMIPNRPPFLEVSDPEPDRRSLSVLCSWL
jgi:hypothetical protein